MKQSAIVTVAYGQSTERLDYTFLSFAEKNPSIPLHAFVIGQRLPERRLPQITYHLVEPVPDFSHPLREVYFRRMLLMDQLGVDYVLTVDSYDVLCLQSLPNFESLVGDAAFGACTEHLGARYIMGQGYTSNFLNCGVVFWNVAASHQIRQEIVARGRSHFRTIADDQFCLNEVAQTNYYDQVRILPCQYNYRCYLGVRKRGWPTVSHLDGVKIYHNFTCMDAAKRISNAGRATLPKLERDPGPLTQHQQFWRRLRNRFVPHIVK
jgi:hypothetical protein